MVRIVMTSAVIGTMLMAAGVYTALPAAAGGSDAIAIPRILSYQGKLTDTLGVPVADTLYSVRFRLYTQPSGGTQFWEETQSVRTRAGLFPALLGSVMPISALPDGGEVYLGMAVDGGAELLPRLRIASAAYAFLCERAANADLLQGRDTAALDGRYVNEGQANAVSSAMITDGTIAASDLGQMGATAGQVMKWTGSAWEPRNDSVGVSGGGTATSVGQGTGVVCTPNPITTTGTVGFDQAYGDGRYINEGQTAGGDLAGTYPNPTIAQKGATSNQVLKWNGTTWVPANEAWVRVGTDSILYTSSRVGIARGGSFNILHGTQAYTQTNLGAYQCTTGVAGVSYDYQTVSGGFRCVAESTSSTVGGGYGNKARGQYSTVAGGFVNTATGSQATVSGGYVNSAAGENSVVGGGAYDTAAGRFSMVSGGYSNTASGNGATVGGGGVNTASGLYSTVPGGEENAARGRFSFAAGCRAKSNHSGSFVWGDSTYSDSVYTTGANQFRARARGGTWFFSNAGMTTGAYLAPGSNSWASACDSATKEDFRDVDKQELLRKVAGLRVRNYKLKDQNDGTRHIGPVAQEFHAAFGVGENEKSINLADADGVLLAAVQALYEQNQQLFDQNQDLRAELDALKAELVARK